MTGCKFSLITICYNSGNTIERTIQSVLNQTYKDYEYVIVDGGSKDSTLDIIKKYEPLFDGRMAWSSEPDKGIYNAMNKGVKRCSGDIVGIVNSDDWLDKSALQIVSNSFIAQTNPTNCLFCGGIKFIFNDGSFKYLHSDIKLFKKYACLYEMAGIRHPAVFVPRTLYQNYGVFDENIKISADADLILRFYHCNVEFVEIPQIISNMSDGGASNSRVLKQRIADKWIILENNNVSIIAKIFIMAEWMIRQLIKEAVPYSILKKVRR